MWQIHGAGASARLLRPARIGARAASRGRCEPGTGEGGAARAFWGVLPLQDPQGLAPRLDAAAIEGWRALPTLHHVVKAGLAVVDVVVQDEYTHDVVVRAAEGLYLVYDST